MVSGATSLNLVRDELFTTMFEAESSLEQFILERNNGSLLQQAVESLHQVRGTLNLIELAGAELLAQEVLDQATDIPAGAGEERDVQIAALSNALHVLRRYLENVDVHRQEMPELLLPAINDLRQAGGQQPLPESFFFSVRLDQPRPRIASAALDAAAKEVEGRRLRQMYQVGLLGFIREPNPKSSLKLMTRAMQRLDGLFANEPRGRLCWICAAALEAQNEGLLLARQPRKQLFGRVDRELKKMFLNSSYEPPRNLLKELLYLVALSDSNGPQVSALRAVFGLTPLPFTDHLIEEESQRLAGPGKSVMRSLSAAIREELSSVKDMLDLIERGTVQADVLTSLHALLGKMSKTLGMVGLSSAGNSLSEQVLVVATWSEGSVPPVAELHKLADTILYVEGMVSSLDTDQPRMRPAVEPQRSEAELFAYHQLLEARIVVIDEAQAGLALSKRAITAYLESNGDRMHLSNVPFSLQAVRGGLWFLGQERAAELIGACASYIQTQMVDTTQMPSEHMLETLADALSSLEYYLEAGAVMREETRPSVLDLAADSVRTLGLTVAA
ncbi:ferrous iron transporter B [Pseudomonas segetis]|uniref:Scaffold protein FimL second domain-containing protein n=1 Tax=Pseudomonas segetis TaxID=298908 RepID=A0A239A923_9PSED|nr:ferrous iron transporter B [Pseudomonas segetis]SNR92115.1 hypothetical protein SAMN05216255_1002 [Pseudomonas segetis]